MCFILPAITAVRRLGTGAGLWETITDFPLQPALSGVTIGTLEAVCGAAVARLVQHAVRRLLRRRPFEPELTDSIRHHTDKLSVHSGSATV